MKLPRTLHIEGSGLPKNRTDPETVPFKSLAGKLLFVEEKVDGTGVSLFFDDKLDLQVYHRGSSATSREFNQLRTWATNFQDSLFDLLGDRYVMFGEWMLHKHTIFYDQLPHYFLESDMYDRQNGIWMSTMARVALLQSHEYIQSVAGLGFFKPQKLNELTDLVQKSLYQSSDLQTF